MLSSNPCAEVIGSTGNIFYNDELVPIGDICDLGSISLVKYYDIVSKKFNMDKFLEDSKLMVESLDNVIECSNYPLPEYENAAKLKRKIGVGLTAVGSLMMMMNIRYGSNECINFLDDLLSKFINTLYQASALLAKEKGAFPLYDEKILECGYVANSGVLTDETKELVKKYGLRNAALSAIAPNGTLSILAGNVSGGLEPVFAREGYRWYRLEGKKPTFKYPRIDKGEWFETDYFVEDEVSGEKYLISTDGEYRIDKSNGLCKKIKIRDYGYNIANENGFTNVATATELSVEEHLNVLSVFAKYIDQSCSKTINLPSDITFDDFKKLYTNVHSLGIKGCTTYREGSSVAVLESEKKHKEKTIKEQQEDFLDSFKNHNGSVVVEQNVSLPEEYPARGYILRSEGKKWYLHVAFKDKSKTKPFAMFVNTNAREDNVPTFNALEKLEALALHKGLRKELVEQNKQKFAYQKNPVKICRTLGFLLRHNVDVYEIVKALDEVEEADVATFVFRIKKFLAQFVDRIDEPQKCPACGEYALVFQEGCFLCTACGSSKCS
jgi:ribonucleoside-diphosphate reductase alpha chain